MRLSSVPLTVHVTLRCVLDFSFKLASQASAFVADRCCNTPNTRSSDQLMRIFEMLTTVVVIEQEPTQSEITANYACIASISRD